MRSLFDLPYEDEEPKKAPEATPAPGLTGRLKPAPTGEAGPARTSEPATRDTPASAGVGRPTTGSPERAALQPPAPASPERADASRGASSERADTSRGASPERADASRGTATGPERRVYSVTELTSRIRVMLEGQFAEVWVEGELSNCRLWNTGHLYFTLKDHDAQLKGIMFKSAYRYLKFKPEDGLKVVARGRISVYPQKGEYQITCEHLEPAGLGALQLAFEQLKRTLAAEGLFDAARKRPLPTLPRKIGVVTSLDGAAIRDIIKVLRRRYANAHIVIRPSRVQGDGAGADVARAIAAITAVEGVDVLIVGRGGGSIEDLWAFNEEVVARAIAACPVPVISAVGHETDVTIADFVADVRAATPSNAAELVVSRKDDFCAHITRLGDRLDGVIHGRLRRLESRLHALEARPGFAGFRGHILSAVRHASELRHELRRIALAGVTARQRRFLVLRQRLDQFDARRRLATIRTRLIAQDSRLDALVRQRQHRADARLRDSVGRLESLSPLAVLGRGYAVCWNADRTAIVRDAGAVRPGDDVLVTLAAGELRCEVTGSAPHATEPVGRRP